MINKKTINEAISKYKIFIVDDQLANVVLLENILNLSGFKQILSTTDSNSAIEKIGFHQPHLLLLDLMMPGVTGFEILSELSKTSEKYDFMPVLVLTADTSPKSKEKALSLGANDFLTKPFDINEVNLRITNLLTTKFLMDQLKHLNHFFQQEVEARTEKLMKEKEATEQNEKKFRSLFEANLDPINLFFLEEFRPTNFILSNPASKTILGYTEEELVNLDIIDLVIGFFDKNPIEETFKKLKDTGSIEIETFIRKKNGNLSNMEVRLTIFELEDKTAVLASYREKKDKTGEILLHKTKSPNGIAFPQSHGLVTTLANLTKAAHSMRNLDFENQDAEIEKKLQNIIDSSIEIDNLIKKKLE